MLTNNGWMTEPPRLPGVYVWWQPDVKPMPCSGVVRVVPCEAGFGWPAGNGRYVQALGACLPDLLQAIQTVWRELPLDWFIL